MFSQLIERIKKSTYILQILTLMSGTIIAQVLMLAIIPVLTRLYTPEEFGIYSLFLSIVFILGVVASWKYELAIMLPKRDRDAQALVFLSLIITISMVFGISLILLVFHDLLIEHFPEISSIIWLIPIGVLLTGLFQIFTAYSSRHQFYKKIASVKVTNAFTIASVQTMLRYFLNWNGLISGKIIADIVSVSLFVTYHIKKQTLQLKHFSKRRIYYNAKKYDNFPKYQSFTVFLNAISQNLPVLMLTSLFSAEAAGFYALTTRVLQAPVSLVGGSTREVYYQRASRLYANGEDIFALYKKTTLGLLKIFLVPFLVISLFGEDLFRIIFGENWNISGYIAQIMVLWFMLLFINTPSIITFSILGLQKIQMYLEIVSVIMRILSIYAGFYFFDSFIASIVFYTIYSVLFNITLISYIFTKLKFNSTMVLQKGKS
ncbi:MAG: hypothetical protein B6D59_01825 [Campylobacteraceae bacterium 4484_4]|nr:MAG: hypothetical protein B6D59_01825 [Campylobacteraceae bacterium 4484_4]